MITKTTTLPLEYGPLVRELHERASKIRQPINGTFELTERCNLACKMCYICQSPNNTILRSKELTSVQWLDLAKKAHENGMHFLLLTGGEIFLRSDFFEIYTPLTQMGITIILFTNGTLITNSVAERLAEAPPNRTDITFYGATAETYEAITGVSGSYKRCCAGIEALIKHHIPLGLKTTLTRRNMSELEAMKQMANNWGLRFSASWLLSKRRDGEQSDVEEYRMTPSECVLLESKDPVSNAEMSDTAMIDPSLGNNNAFYCMAGKAAFVINSIGEMNVCLEVPFPSALPLEIGFRPAWEKVQQFVDLAPPLSNQCMECKSRPFCPHCPGWSLIENGTLTEPVPYLCEIAKIREDRYRQAK